MFDCQLTWLKEQLLQRPDDFSIQMKKLMKRVMKQIMPCRIQG
jgi:hypothetical protein